VNTLINEVNGEYYFWPPNEEYITNNPPRAHRDEEYPVNSIPTVIDATRQDEESGTVIAHDDSGDYNRYIDTVSNQVDSNNTTINLDE